MTLAVILPQMTLCTMRSKGITTCNTTYVYSTYSVCSKSWTDFGIDASFKRRISPLFGFDLRSRIQRQVRIASLTGMENLGAGAASEARQRAATTTRARTTTEEPPGELEPSIEVLFSYFDLLLGPTHASPSSLAS